MKHWLMACRYEDRQYGGGVGKFIKGRGSIVVDVTLEEKHRKLPSELYESQAVEMYYPIGSRPVPTSAHSTITRAQGQRAPQRGNPYQHKRPSKHVSRHVIIEIGVIGALAS
jgi:hypothetical protein